MNRPRSASVSQAVQRRIASAGVDRLWTLADFRDLDAMPVAATLSRLVKKGTIKRIRRGVYYRPKPTIFGLSDPQPDAVLNAMVQRRHGAVLPSGEMQYNRLGLTDQVSAAITVASDRRLRTTPIKGIRVNARIRPLRQQRGIRADERAAFDALRDLSRIPGADSTSVILRLRQLIQTGQLDLHRLIRYAKNEPPRVRALLGAIADDLGHTKDAEGLKASLNPLSVYRLAGAVPLRGARAWGIQDASI